MTRPGQQSTKASSATKRPYSSSSAGGGGPSAPKKACTSATSKLTGEATTKSSQPGTSTQKVNPLVRPSLTSKQPQGPTAKATSKPSTNKAPTSGSKPQNAPKVPQVGANKPSQSMAKTGASKASSSAVAALAQHMTSKSAVKSSSPVATSSSGGGGAAKTTPGLATNSIYFCFIFVKFQRFACRAKPVGLFELTRCPSRALDSPRELLPELQRNENTVRLTALGAEVPGHRQQQLTQTLIVCLLKM